MPLTLPVPLFYTGITQLLDQDENVILQRLYDRDQTLYVTITELQTIREDLFAQFNRLDDVEGRVRGLNNILNAIISSFYLDIDQNGIVGDNYAFFIQLIADLKTNINSINAVTGGIVNFLAIQAQIQPVADHVAKLEDLDYLIQEKLNYIYSKWDVNPNDDIISV